jgi:hypothetical protein
VQIPTDELPACVVLVDGLTSTERDLVHAAIAVKTDVWLRPFPNCWIVAGEMHDNADAWTSLVAGVLIGSQSKKGSVLSLALPRSSSRQWAVHTKDQYAVQTLQEGL